MADDFRLLVDLLRHEVAVIALLDEEGPRRDALGAALHGLVRLVVEGRAFAVEHDPVALFQIGDEIGEGGERQRIRAEIHLTVADADRERRALAGADQQIVLPLEQEGQREGAVQAREAGGDGIDRCLAAVELTGNEMGDDLGVGLRFEHIAIGLELCPQLAEILDNAVMNDGELGRGVRMRICLVGLAMRRPARVADADQPFQRLARQPDLEILELALGAATGELPALERRDAGRIVAAIFEPPQRLDHLARDRFLAQNPDDAAHAHTSSAVAVRDPLSGFAPQGKITLNVQL